ncbi:MAG: long-chain acyl-CoA synthetase, partial [Pseudonocardiales bacterium]|nr:long-chain acyl-CoA synthetase [Pseudonocardiales bacterium]
MTALGLWNIAGQEPDRTAVVDPGGGTVSYGELAAAADRYARGLHQMGLRAGDAIVLMMPNCAEMLAVHFAALQTGLYIVAVNWHLVGPEVAYILSD